MWINERVRRTLTTGVVVALAGVIAAGCGDDEQAPPTTGAIAVTTVTTGDNPDADGYAISLDGNVAGNIGVNDQLIIPDQTAGTYSVGLTNIAANCTVADDNPRDMVVTAGLTANTTFNVDCPGAPAAVTIAAATAADEVTLTWELSPLATSYRAELVGGTADLTKILADDAVVAVFTAVDDDLEDGVTYAATVYAINAEGEAASNEEDVATNFFPWDEFLPTSLHATGEGMRAFYAAENNGFDQYVGVDYETLNCKNCHAKATVGDCTMCHTESDPQLGSQVDATLTGACGPGGCHGRQKAEAGQGFTDVHFDMGFDCMSCHSLEDVHGDGNSYTSFLDEGAIDAKCENCHTSIPANAYHFASHVGADLTTPDDDPVDCGSCHIQSVIACYNCHYEGEVYGNPPVKIAYGQFRDWVFLMNFRGKVVPANIMSLKWGGDANPDITEKYSFNAIAPYYAHTISRNAVTGCDDCHGNTAIQDYLDDGVMDVVTWNAATSRLEHMTGRVPVPPDFVTSMRLDFVDQPTTDPVGGDPDLWEFFETGPDTVQIFYGSSLTAEQMGKLQ